MSLMIAFLMLLSRVLVPSCTEYNLGKESSLGRMISSEIIQKIRNTYFLESENSLVM